MNSMNKSMADTYTKIISTEDETIWTKKANIHSANYRNVNSIKPILLRFLFSFKFVIIDLF